MTLQTALGYVPSNPNLIINGGFTVNQRAYATGTANAAGVFAHDRWKAGAAGGAYSFTQLDSPTTITITAGTFIQVVETKNVQGGSYVLSWTGTATGRYGLNSATPSGSYVASPILITGQTAGTALSAEFGTGTLTNVKLEMGSVATPFVAKLFAEELQSCKRYCQVLGGDVEYEPISLTAGAATSSTFNAIIPLNPKMRTTPSLIAPISYSNFGMGDFVSLYVLVQNPSIVTQGSSPNRMTLLCTSVANMTQYRAYILYTMGQTTDKLILSAEL